MRGHEKIHKKKIITTLNTKDMKRANTILTMILLVVAGGRGYTQSTIDFITVDITKSYPKKELILQDIFDIEYIALETSDEFITRGIIRDIGNDIIIVTNADMNGDFFLFDRNGKGLRKINRKGQGPGEYIFAIDITLNEDNNEMIITDMNRNMLVYDLFGNFKRRLHNSRDVYGNLGNFDRDHFICLCLTGNLVNGKMQGRERNEIFIISKKDGSIIKEIEFPFEEKKWPIIVSPDGTRVSSSPGNFPWCPYRNNWVITEISSDTIYSLLPDFSLVPFIVRTPSIQSMDPEVFLYQGVISERYYFMQTVKREYDFSTGTGWPRTNLVYDRQENAINECMVYNTDT